MTRNFIKALAIVIMLASCSSTRPINSMGNKQTSLPPVSKTTSDNSNKKANIKFLDEITADPQLAKTIPDGKTEKDVAVPASGTNVTGGSLSASDNSALQAKYAALLETDPDQIQSLELFKSIDEWYGTRYRMGGNSKSGIDCSAFVQAVYLSAFGLAIPRTAFEQFKVTNRISATEMKEGDLVFFNTTGGVSHVGIYVGNNKFAHASVAHGVTVSDLFDPYYLKRFLGVGRIEKPLGTR